MLQEITPSHHSSPFCGVKGLNADEGSKIDGRLPHSLLQDPLGKEVFERE
jgi:hypothetical protein